METVTINKAAIVDLMKIKEDFDAVIDSLELMSDKNFMASYSEAKKQIKNKKFDDWNEL